MTFGLLALMIAAAFASAAFYINFAEHPARIGLPVAYAIQQWKPAYKQGFILQASLAVIGGACGLVQYFSEGSPLWLIGALLLLANWPFTLLVIMPTNRKLLAMVDAPGPDAGDLLARWNRLHAVRTILGLASAAILFAAAMDYA